MCLPTTERFIVFEPSIALYPALLPFTQMAVKSGSELRCHTFSSNVDDLRICHAQTRGSLFLPSAYTIELPVGHFHNSELSAALFIRMSMCCVSSSLL
jgi:hypothetical protein